MTRRRYIQDPKTYEMIEVTNDYEPPARESARNRGALWNDRHYDGIRATDGADISSRKKHRDYMRRTGLTTVDDFSSSWAKAKESRENYYKSGGSFKRTDVERAMYEVNNRKR
jgi:hypothetical protein